MKNLAFEIAQNKLKNMNLYGSQSNRSAPKMLNKRLKIMEAINKLANNRTSHVKATLVLEETGISLPCCYVIMKKLCAQDFIRSKLKGGIKYVELTKLGTETLKSGEFK